MSEDARRLRNVQHLLELVHDDLDNHRQELIGRLDRIRDEDPSQADTLDFTAQIMGELIGQLQAAIDSASALVDGIQ